MSDIIGLYKHLFENDLNWTKNKTQDEVLLFREK